MLEASIVGSLPKPSWLAVPNMLRAPWRLDGRELSDAQDDAVRLAILEQEQAGLATVTDGEVRRRHYIWGFLDGLTGIDTANLAKARSRGGRYSDTTEVARIVGPVERKCPVLLPSCQFARAATTRRLKVTMPGPMTIVDSVADEHYGTDRKTLAMKFAAILNAEARELAAAGADVIQFDEPCFNIYLEEVEAWGIEALEACMDGVAPDPGCSHLLWIRHTRRISVEDAEYRLGALRGYVSAARQEQRGPGLGRVCRFGRGSGRLA